MSDHRSELAHIAPGAFTALVGPNVAMLLGAPADSALSSNIATAILDEGDLDALVAALTTVRLHDLPTFACAIDEGHGVRFLVRGRVSALARRARLTERIDGLGVVTWCERVLTDVASIELALDADGPPDSTIRVGLGVVAASALTRSIASPEPKRDSSPPTGVDDDAARATGMDSGPAPTTVDIDASPQAARSRESREFDLTHLLEEKRYRGAEAAAVRYEEGEPESSESPRDGDDLRSRTDRAAVTAPRSAPRPDESSGDPLIRPSSVDDSPIATGEITIHPHTATIDPPAPTSPEPSNGPQPVPAEPGPPIDHVPVIADELLPSADRDRPRRRVHVASKRIDLPAWELPRRESQGEAGVGSDGTQRDDGTEPEGHWIGVSDLRALRESRSDTDRPIVQAVHCEAGHPNPPHAETCRVCEVRIDRRVVSKIERPSLGTLRGDGLVVELDRPAVLGRRPPRDERVLGAAAQIVEVPDPDQVLSPSHCEIRLVDWQVQVVDRHSLNGTLVELLGKPPVQLSPGEPFLVTPGARVHLGEVVSFVYEIAG